METAAAVLSQTVKGTIAENTAEGVRICTFVAGEIFTFPVLEKVVMGHILSSKCFSNEAKHDILSSLGVGVMTVLIDGDGCPVVDITVKLCTAYQVPCIIMCDTAHLFDKKGAKTLVFDKGADSVDYALVNRVSPGDIVITQDYGLASMCLSRRAQVLHQDGWSYTAENIDALLLVRHTSRKLRDAGNRRAGPKKRTQNQDIAFVQALESLLQTSVQG